MIPFSGGFVTRFAGDSCKFFVSFFTMKLSKKKKLQFWIKNAMIMRTRIGISNCFSRGGVTMPNIKSAKKRVKVIAAKTEKNKALRSALRTDIKKANIAIETGAADKDQAVRLAVKKIDQAVAKGLLRKNTAARRKSALAKKAQA